MCIRDRERGDEVLSINGVQLSSVSRLEVRQFVAETPLTVILVVRRGGGPQPLRAGRIDLERACGDAAATRGYALQTCKRSVRHDGFELRQVTFQTAAATDNLGLRLQRRSLDGHTYCQVTARGFT